MTDFNASVCVFCGSRMGTDPEIERTANALGTWFARSGVRLVYGAGGAGVMGAIATAVRKAGGRTLGVIPSHLVHHESAELHLNDCIVTNDMHSRKEVMFVNSDAVVALPGGPGTLDELFEVLTWRQLGMHGKPVLLLNVNGFWDPLLELIEHQIEAGFADWSFRESLEDFRAEGRLIRRLGQILGCGTGGHLRQDAPGVNRKQAD